MLSTYLNVCAEIPWPKSYLKSLETITKAARERQRRRQRIERMAEWNK